MYPFKLRVTSNNRSQCRIFCFGTILESNKYICNTEVAYYNKITTTKLQIIFKGKVESNKLCSYATIFHCAKHYY